MPLALKPNGTHKTFKTESPAAMPGFFAGNRDAGRRAIAP